MEETSEAPEAGMLTRRLRDSAPYMGGYRGCHPLPLSSSCPPAAPCSELVEVMQPEEVLLPNGMAWDTAKGARMPCCFASSSTTAWRQNTWQHTWGLRAVAIHIQMM